MPFVFQKNWRERDESPAQQRVLEIKDRERPGRIRCRVLVAREETRSDWSATIKLSYVSLDACGSGFGNHAFTGKWERFPGGEQKVSVTGGNLMLYGDGIPRGAHIGTYLLDEVVRWARQWPAAQVRQISLSSVDGGDDNRERRNQLYEQFGISRLVRNPWILPDHGLPFIFSGTGSAPWLLIQGSLTPAFRRSPSGGRTCPYAVAACRIRFSSLVRL